MGQIAGEAAPFDDNPGLRKALDQLERLTSVLRKPDPPPRTQDPANPVHALQATTEAAFAAPSETEPAPAAPSRRTRPAITPAPTLLSMKQASAMTTLSVSSIKRMMAAGTFPQPVRLGESRIAFVDSEIHAWIRQRIAARR